MKNAERFIAREHFDSLPVNFSSFPKGENRFLARQEWLPVEKEKVC